METTNSHLGKYEFIADINTLHWVWQEGTKNATWEEMQNAMLEYANLSEKYRAANHIINEQNQYFIFVPIYQTWIDQNISTRTVESGCKRFALIKSNDIFIEVAVQQIFGEENSSKISFQEFNNFEEAEQWINSFYK